MGLPILSEAFDGVRWIIDFFIDKVPKPIKILIFLLFLLFFGTVLSFAMNIFGVHCNDQKQPVTLEWYDITTNLQAIFQKSRILTDENLTISDIHPVSRYVDQKCAYYLKNESGELINCPEDNTTGCLYYFKQPECFNCNTTNTGWIYFGGIDWDYIGPVCSGDAYYKQLSFSEKYFSCIVACDIPLHYKFNHITGSYDCIDLAYCGPNATLVSQTELDVLLTENEASLLYPTTIDKRSVNNLITIKCNNNYNPRLTFFGIDIFDYRLWLFLIVIYVLAILLFKLKR